MAMGRVHTCVIVESGALYTWGTDGAGDGAEHAVLGHGGVSGTHLW